MRNEVFHLWHLVQKRNSLEDAAASLSSPGFEPHYSSGHAREAPFERYILAACDMQDEIDAAVMDVVNSYETDNADILAKTSGQRQRALRLCFICGKNDEYIADRLGVNVWTVERRLRGDYGEKAPEGKFTALVAESRLLPIDAEVEEHLARTYRNVQRMVGETYREVEELILVHERRAADYRRQVEVGMEQIKRIVEGLDGKKRDIAKGWFDGMSVSEIQRKSNCSLRYVQKVLSGL